jgi:hypothetical protein
VVLLGSINIIILKIWLDLKMLNFYKNVFFFWRGTHSVCVIYGRFYV